MSPKKRYITLKIEEHVAVEFKDAAQEALCNQTDYLGQLIEKRKNKPKSNFF